MKKTFFILSAAIAFALFGDVRNPGFNKLNGNPPKQADIDKAKEKGMVCPNQNDWPFYWFPSGTGKIEIDKKGFSGPSVRLTAPAGIRGYHGEKLEGDLTCEVYLRGHGTFNLLFWNYEKVDNKARFVPPANGIRPVYQEIDSDVWTRYTFYLEKPANIWNMHPTFFAYKGTIELDEVSFRHTKNAGYLAVAKAEARLRKEKRFVNNTALVAVDDAAKVSMEAFRKQTEVLADFMKKNPENETGKDLTAMIEAIRPYLFADGIKTIKVDHWNRMNAISYAVEALTKKTAALSSAPVSGAKQTEQTAADSKNVPVVIGSIKPNSIRYDENGHGNVRYDLINNTGAPLPGTLKLVMRSGLHNERVLMTKKVTLKPGKQSFNTSYNVGPETFGREIEVTFTSGKGNASAKEYFQVAKEFMRIMMHGTGKYQNFAHFFASETSDFGVKKTDDLEYLSAQPRYHMKWAARLPRFRHLQRDIGIKTSFYQAKAFAAQQGIEEVRKHPEYILYDEDGLPARDFFYGGIPDPFEIASPIEINPERRKKILDGKDFLDVKISGWHHYIPDFTNLDCIEYGTKCIRDYQKAVGFDVMYLDNTPTVTVGYTYEGKQNIEGMTPEDIANLNAKITHAWNSGLRKDNPDAGSWCNGVNPGSARWMRSLGQWMGTAGMGIDSPEFKDPNDNYIRAMTSYSNTMLLSEVQHLFVQRFDNETRYPDKWLDICLERRDYIVQKYKGNVVVGYLSSNYNGPKPMPRNAYWPTLTYFLAYLAATQHHHIIYTHAMPARDAFDQFVTRYSAFIWDKELNAIPKDQAKKEFKVESPSKLLWENFVYNRKYDDSEITLMHLVRPYPLKTWDLEWDVPASILHGVKVEFPIPAGKKPVMAKAMRPNLPEEKDEVVEQILPITVKDGKVVLTVSDFSYYSMVAVKFQ